MFLRAELFSSHGSENTRSYYDTLADQVTARDATKVERMKSDVSEQQRHFEAWDGYWGRPGNGAPQKQGLDLKELFLSSFIAAYYKIESEGTK